MSTQRGNHVRTRPQKHKNRSVFKNDLHDTNHRTKAINGTQIYEVCTRCKDIIQWKIKYKKYKPLSQPTTCVKCLERTVKKAYHVMCSKCSSSLKLCAKCCESKELVPPVLDERERLKLDTEMKHLLQTLPERKRRTFLRYMSRKELEEGDAKAQTVELEEKLKKLVVEEQDEDDDDDFSEDDSDVDE